MLQDSTVDGLLCWYQQHRRDLPWRRTQEPWAIWVSEIMLQQTRVDTVGPYWQRFLDRFPTPAALADADEQEVLQLWAGLGYYRRARLLHQAAQEVVRSHGGEVPGDPKTFVGLPGVGRYTAGAVMSIAFGRREPIVDGNVARVLARRFRLTGQPGTTPYDKRLWDLAEQVLPEETPGDFNQALMELGAIVCTPIAPKCEPCPLHDRCEARAAGEQESLPAPSKRARIRPIRAACAVITDGRGQWLLARRPPGGLLEGLWEFPGVPLESTSPEPSALAQGLAQRVGLEIQPEALTPLGDVTHVFTHRRLTLTAFSCLGFTGDPKPLGYPEVRWVSPDDPGVPLPKVTRKVAALVGSA